MGLVVFLSPSILLTELKDTGVYVESYTSLYLLHPGVDLLHQSQLRTEPQLHPNPLAISCLGEVVAADASQDITSDKAHKKKKIRICNTSQSLLKTAVLIHNNSCYNKRAFKDFKSELIYSSDCIKN